MNYNDASLVLTANAFKAGKLYAVKGTDLTVTRATSATRVNANGIIETVAANVPLIDHTGGGCPTILVQPQRTNLLKYSQDFKNSVWTKVGSITLTKNYSVAPDGTSTRVQWDGTSFYQIFQYISNSSPVYGSLYVKGVTGQTIIFNGITITFNGQWQRIEGLLLIDGSLYISISGSSASGTTALDYEIWGAQAEEGIGATSYIPTTSATVTRNADVITLTPTTGLSEIKETFSDGTTNTITTIPSTYTMSQGRIKNVVMK
jgi:hypothetical protein